MVLVATQIHHVRPISACKKVLKHLESPFIQIYPDIARYNHRQSVVHKKQYFAGYGWFQFVAKNESFFTTHPVGWRSN